MGGSFRNTEASAIIRCAASSHHSKGYTSFPLLPSSSSLCEILFLRSLRLFAAISSPACLFHSGDHLIRRPLDRVLEFHHFLFLRIKIHFPGQLAGLFFEFSRLRRNLSLINRDLVVLRHR